MNPGCGGRHEPVAAGPAPARGLRLRRRKARVFLTLFPPNCIFDSGLGHYPFEHLNLFRVSCFEFRIWFRLVRVGE